MISPQRFSKSLAQNKLKIGITLKEMVLISCVPAIGNYFDFYPLVSFLLFLVALGLLVLKSNFLEPRYIQNSMEKKTHLKWQRIDIQ